MPISVNWGTSVIYIPKDYLALIAGVLYELDVDQFRLDLKDLEDNEEGMPFPDTHTHETETTLSGDTYARKVIILSPYTVEFEDGQYVVKCVGANHNIADVKVANQVSLIIGNSAGLIVRESGVSGLTPEESDLLAAMKACLMNRIRVNKADGTYTIYDEDKVTPLFTGTLTDDGTFKDRTPA